MRLLIFSVILFFLFIQLNTANAVSVMLTYKNDSYVCYANNATNLVGYNIVLHVTNPNISVESKTFMIVWDFIDPSMTKIGIMGVTYEYFNGDNIELFRIYSNNSLDVEIVNAEILEWDNTTNSFYHINLTTGYTKIEPIYPTATTTIPAHSTPTSYVSPIVTAIKTVPSTADNNKNKSSVKNTVNPPITTPIQYMITTIKTDQHTNVTPVEQTTNISKTVNNKINNKIAQQNYTKSKFKTETTVKSIPGYDLETFAIVIFILVIIHRVMRR